MKNSIKNKGCVNVFWEPQISYFIELCALIFNVGSYIYKQPFVKASTSLQEKKGTKVLE